MGHIARNCPKGSYNNNYSGGGGGGSGGPSNSYGGGSVKTCYSCGGIGHMSRTFVPSWRTLASN